MVRGQGTTADIFPAVTAPCCRCHGEPGSGLLPLNFALIELETYLREVGSFTITEKAATRAFSVIVKSSRTFHSSTVLRVAPPASAAEMCHVESSREECVCGMFTASDRRRVRC